MEDTTAWNRMGNGGKRIPRPGDGSLQEGRFGGNILMAAEAFMVEFHYCLAESWYGPRE